MFGPYRLEILLGRGGMGEVYRAFDTARDRLVALKVLPAHLSQDAEFLARFRREARIAARLSDPHVIPIHDYGEIDGRLFLDMRLIVGEDLGVVLGREGRLAADRVVALVEQVASALDSAHETGIVHRDVKPSNVLLTAPRAGRAEFAYLGDFGIARPVAPGSGSGLTATGAAVGTLHYMAPERFTGAAIGIGVDVYALACTMYECLTGQPPFPGGDLPSLVHSHLHRPPPRPSSVVSTVPHALDDVVVRGMAKDPAERFGSAGALAVAAREALFPRPAPVVVRAGVTIPPDRSVPVTDLTTPGRRRRRGLVVAGALVFVVAVAVATTVALRGGSGAGPAPDPVAAGVHNPSTVRGGTIRFANSGDWDSLDPADTYYGYAQNFSRLYGRSLVMFASAPGAAGAALVPDLAESLGVPGDGGRTWTYRVRKGVKFEDGTAVTSKDVKYAVERSLDRTAFPNGPTYFNDLVAAIETPDDDTVVFRLKAPFGGFDYIAQLPATIPVEAAKDTGATYKEHVVATGPYMFASNDPGKAFTLVRNPHWDPATDPNRTALPDRIEVALNVGQADIDRRLLAGDLDVDVTGSGMLPATAAAVHRDPARATGTDSAPLLRTWFTTINGDVAPLDDVHCRRAVEFAADRAGYRAAYGGEIATSLLPPGVTGSQRLDPYPSPGHTGDLGRAREELATCGRPNGFATNIAYRAERPQDEAAATALQQSLARVGITLTLTPYPGADYLKLYAGKPEFATGHGLGLMVYGWGADWPDGYGFLPYIVDSRTIRPEGGNANLGVKDPAVDGLVDEATRTVDAATRAQRWVGVDRSVLEDAFVLPGSWPEVQLYRPPGLTNVFVTGGFQMYDYLALGTTRP